MRTTLAHLAWWVCVSVAAGYAGAALLTGLDAPADRRWVEAVQALADAAGGAVFAGDGWLAERLGGSAGVSSPTRVALVSWGSASAAWLVLGWALSAVVAPPRRRVRRSRRVS